MRTCCIEVITPGEDADISKNNWNTSEFGEFAMLKFFPLRTTYPVSISQVINSGDKGYHQRVLEAYLKIFQACICVKHRCSLLIATEMVPICLHT